MRRFTLAALAAAAVVALPSAAMAHPRLLSATPAAQATVTRPTQIKLSFSETVVAPLSGIDLVMTGMPGMASHQPMPIRGFKSVAQGKDLVASLPRALPSGSYELKWHAVGADQHRAEGAYSFNVR